jgi:predicted RNA methylase
MADAKLSPEVIDILKRSTITANSLILPPQQLERKLYEDVNKALVNAGGKWNRSAGAHLFNSDPRAKLGLGIETGVVIDEKKLYQAFFTPPELAKRVVELADVKGKTVLEPSAGIGALAHECLAFNSTHVVCVEINKEFCDKLWRISNCAVFNKDFLEFDPHMRFECVVMNPPFRVNTDCKHVRHALKFLAQKGRLVSIMGGNIGRPAFTALLSDIEDSGRQYRIHDVEEGAFKESGTNIKTIILEVW